MFLKTQRSVKSMTCHTAVLLVDNPKLQPVGQLYIQERSSFSFLHSFYIHERYRSRGWGKCMLRNALKRCESNRVVLTVFDDNILAIRLYTKLGFKEFLRERGVITMEYYHA
jgi:ribosomal protein S18 acetylase RimI-like enzyme